MNTALAIASTVPSPPAWRQPMDRVEEAEAIGRLKQMNRWSKEGLRRQLAFGAELWDVKVRLPHTKFGPWLKTNCAEISWRWANVLMLSWRGALDHCKLTPEGFIQIRSSFQFAHSGDLLLLEPDRIPDGLKAIRETIFGLVDGKSHRQFLLDVKSTTDDGNGEVIVKRPGGDGVWRKWVEAQHPELVKDGKVPSRERVPAKVRKDFDAERDKATDSPDRLEQHARECVADWLRASADLRKANAHLPLLPPQDFVSLAELANGLAGLFATLAKRRK